MSSSLGRGLSRRKAVTEMLREVWMRSCAPLFVPGGKLQLGLAVRRRTERPTRYDSDSSDPHEFTNLADKSEMKDTVDQLKQLLHNPP